MEEISSGGIEKLRKICDCILQNPKEWKFCFSFFQGSLEDWDTAVQKTETRLARVNEQRMKVMTVFVGSLWRLW